MRDLRRSVFSVAGVLGLGAAFIGPAAAQNAADFFKGKTITYIVATAPGGGYDLYGRLVSEYMQKYLPGSTIIVKNVPGAGNIVGTNLLYASKPDGLTIGTFNTGLIYAQMIGREGIRFDITKMSWIGKASSDPRVITINAKSPIKNFADFVASKEPQNFSTGGIGGSAYIETVMLTEALKLPVKMLSGYYGGDDYGAMRRGEVIGTIASRSTWEQFVHNGYGRFNAQIGGTTTDVPQLRDLVPNASPSAKALIALVQSQGDLQRFTAGPPGIPKERLDALRKAYKQALEDPELQAKAAKLDRPVDPAYGDEVLEAVKVALNQPPETVALLKQTLAAGEGTAPPTVKGAVAEWDGRAKIAIKADDGDIFKAEISGSRTEITIGGQKSPRENIKVGMQCTIQAPSGGEAKSLDCK
jgi:tripartite-type tricarboxylate transporter receptor subunit TctC